MISVGIIIDKYHLEYKVSDLLKYLKSIANVKIYIEESYLLQSSRLTFDEDVFFVKAKGDLVLSYVKLIEEETSIPVINPSRAIWLCINRFMNSVYLKKAGIPVADFSMHPEGNMPLFKDFIIKNIIDQKKYKFNPIITEDNGFFRVSDKRALEEVYGEDEKYKYYYYQKFIKSNWEYKLYGIGEDVYFSKQLPILDNPNKLESRQKIERIPELEEYCYKAMEVMDLKLTSLDFLKSNEDLYYLTDINCTPNFNYIKNGSKIVGNLLIKEGKK